jgi:predicted transcriptional regulator
MKNTSLLSSLEKIGLSPREAAVYLAAISLGECGMSELASKSGIQRTSAYVTVESLEQKGLIGTFKTKRGTRYLAKDPKFMLEELQRNTDLLEQVLPELSALQKKSVVKPVVTYYEGVDAYIRAVELCLKKSNTTIRHIGSIAEGHKTLGEDYDFKYFAPTRIKKHIYLKALYTPDTPHSLGGRADDGMLREILFLPASYPMKTLTLIFGSTVVISTTRKTLVTVVIESDEIAEAERSKFDLLFDLIKKAS